MPGPSSSLQSECCSDVRSGRRHLQSCACLEASVNVIVEIRASRRPVKTDHIVIAFRRWKLSTKNETSVKPLVFIITKNTTHAHVTGDRSNSFSQVCTPPKPCLSGSRSGVSTAVHWQAPSQRREEAITSLIFVPTSQEPPSASWEHHSWMRLVGLYAR